MRSFVKNKRKLLSTILIVTFFLTPFLTLAQTTINPAPPGALPLNNDTSYSPVRNILDGSLPESTAEELFKKYGTSLNDYVAVKNRQWENDRISCAEDVHDFLYGYMKRGRGNTPSSQWSRLLQPNFFQGREGPWNDYDGDNAINGQKDPTTGLWVIPQPRNSNPTEDSDFTDDFDDAYGFGVPNIYSPLVEKFGRNSTVASVMSALGLTLDSDNDQDNIANADDPYPFFATYGDADFDHTATGPDDIYRRIIYVDGEPQFNTQTNSTSEDNDGDGIKDTEDVAPFVNNSELFINHTTSPRPSPTGGQYTVTEVGGLLNFAYNTDLSTRSIAGFTAKTAFETEEIKKILVDNCVRMADLQGIMGRLEFKELIADRVGREVASEKIKQQTKAIVNTVNNGYDSDGDREPDSSQYFDRSNDFPKELGLTTINISDEYDRSGNQTLIDAKNLFIVNSTGDPSKKTDSEIVTPAELSAFNSFQNSGKTKLASRKTGASGGFLSRLSLYFRAAVGPTSGPDLGILSQEDAAFFWETLGKIMDPNQPNNPGSAFMLVADDISSRINQREKELEQEYVANQGFKSYRECQFYTPEGKCEQWATIPGSITKDRVVNQLNTETNQLVNVDEAQDLTPDQQ